MKTTRNTVRKSRTKQPPLAILPGLEEPLWSQKTSDSASFIEKHRTSKIILCSVGVFFLCFLGMGFGYYLHTVMVAPTHEPESHISNLTTTQMAATQMKQAFQSSRQTTSAIPVSQEIQPDLKLVNSVADNITAVTAQTFPETTSLNTTLEESIPTPSNKPELEISPVKTTPIASASHEAPEDLKHNSDPVSEENSPMTQLFESAPASTVNVASTHQPETIPLPTETTTQVSEQSELEKIKPVSAPLIALETDKVEKDNATAVTTLELTDSIKFAQTETLPISTPEVDVLADIDILDTKELQARDLAANMQTIGDFTANTHRGADDILADLHFELQRDAIDTLEENFIEQQTSKQFSRQKDPLFQTYNDKTYIAKNTDSIGDVKIQSWLHQQHIQGVAYRGLNSCFISNKKVFHLGDVINPELVLTWTDIDPQERKLYFIDEDGISYSTHY